MSRRHLPTVRGFTLIELLITLVLLGILLAAGLPAFQTMVNNTQVRTVAEALQNGLRTARTEALRRNQQTVFSFTAATPALGVTAAAGGRNWSLQTIAVTGTTDVSEYLQGGALADVASGVDITATPATSAICFNSNGRLSAPAATGQPGATCAAGGAVVFAVGKSGARALNVTVSAAGQVRMCDPLRTLAAAPDGC